MRVISNTRWTVSRPRTSTSPRPALLSRRSASATLRSPLESRNSSPRRSMTTRCDAVARAARRSISSSSAGAPERSSSPESAISASPALESVVSKSRGATSAVKPKRRRNRGDSVRMPRLRRADCSGPGIRRVARGTRLLLPRRGRATGSTSRRRSSGSASWASRRPGRTCGSAPDPRGHIQATGIDAAGRKQYLYHADWRRRRDQEKFDEMLDFARALPALREHVAADLRAGDALTRERVLACARAAARPRLLPDRHRGVRRDERELRAGHDAQGARDRRGRRDDGVRLPRQERQAAASRRSSTRSRSTSSTKLKRRRGRRRRSCSPTRRAAAGATCARATSTSTSRRSPAPTTRPRTSAPGTRPCSRRSRSASPARWPAPRPAASARSRAPSRRSRYYLGNTPAVCRASYIDPRVFDAYEGGLIIRPALEQAADVPRDDLPIHHRAVEARRDRPDRRALVGARGGEDRRLSRTAAAGSVT